MKKVEERKIGERGAALLMALLLISLLSLVSLVIGTVLTSNIRLTSAFRYKEEAFWAAEAGIEKGLLFFRLNEEESEYPTGATFDSRKYRRTVLFEDGQDISTTVVNVEAEAPNPNTKTFDLKIYDQKKFEDDQFFIGNDNWTREGLTFRVVENCSLTIKWSLVDNLGHETNPGPKTALYLRRNFNDNTFDTVIHKEQIFTEGLTGGSNLGSNVKMVQLKPFIGGSDQGKRVKLLITSTDYIGGPFIYIESIGYHQGVRKQLLVKISREMTTIYNILDYIIFSGSSEDWLPAD